jgi:hypothetical protein
MIIGIVNAANKSEKPLPIIGKFQIIKKIKSFLLIFFF